MSRIGVALAGLAGVVRNGNLRCSELACGAAITAEWAHFVALGVFAYDVGGNQSVSTLRCHSRLI
jgi:hypothetical protein